MSAPKDSPLVGAATVLLISSYLWLAFLVILGGETGLLTLEWDVFRRRLEYFPRSIPGVFKGVFVARMAVILTSYFTAFAANIVIIIGCVRMARSRSYRLAWLTAILAVIPCTSPFCGAGTIPGVFIVIGLCIPAVRKSFR